MKPSETVAIADPETPMIVGAIAYYRSSAERPHENSIVLQQAHVRAWAAKNGIDIIREFSDVGKSASIDEVRPEFNEMMEHLGKCSDFAYVLCVDASRIGRFQDDDRFILLNDQTNKHKKQLIFTAL